MKLDIIDTIDGADLESAQLEQLAKIKLWQFIHGIDSAENKAMIQTIYQSPLTIHSFLLKMGATPWPEVLLVVGCIALYKGIRSQNIPLVSGVAIPAITCAVLLKSGFFSKNIPTPTRTAASIYPHSGDITMCPAMSLKFDENY